VDSNVAGTAITSFSTWEVKFISNIHECEMASSVLSLILGILSSSNVDVTAITAN